MHLALSNNKKFWNNSVKNIYLGPWMMPDILKDNFSEYDFIIPDWHWDNLDKFYSDSLKILNDYEKLIIKLAEVLNELHDLNWSLKAWKILIGPWFKRYLGIIYERNETINILYNSYNLRSCALKNFSMADLQFNDFNEFSKSYQNEDFNNIIYGYILKKIDKEKKINFRELNFKNYKNVEEYKKNSSFKNILRNFFRLRNFNFFIPNFFTKNNYYFHSIYLKNKFELIKLNLKLKNFPYVRLLDLKVKDEKKFDKTLRNKFFEKLKKKLDIKNEDTYESLIVDLIYHMFPRCYLENFEDNDKYSQQVFQLHSPKIIVDSVSYHKDELFKFWLARKIQKDSKLILLQHGGNYENFKIKGDYLHHELDVADKYLSWGWKKEFYNVVSMPCQIAFKKKNNKKDKSIVNLILRPIRFYLLDVSTDNAPNRSGETYINDVIKIANSMNKDKKLKIFLHPSSSDVHGIERGFQLKTYLKKKITNKKIEFFLGKFERHVNDTDFNIFTYLGTPYNQAMSSNIPCLLYNNETYQPLNEDYKHVYRSMLESKLMHGNTTSLTNHINTINYSFNDWWNQSSTIKSKNLFCDNFANSSYNLDILKKNILNIN